MQRTAPPPLLDLHTEAVPHHIHDDAAQLPPNESDWDIFSTNSSAPSFNFGSLPPELRSQILRDAMMPQVLIKSHADAVTARRRMLHIPDTRPDALHPLPEEITLTGSGYYSWGHVLSSCLIHGSPVRVTTVRLAVTGWGTFTKFGTKLATTLRQAISASVTPQTTTNDLRLVLDQSLIQSVIDGGNGQYRFSARLDKLSEAIVAMKPEHLEYHCSSRELSVSVLHSLHTRLANSVREGEYGFKSICMSWDEDCTDKIVLCPAESVFLSIPCTLRSARQASRMMSKNLDQTGHFLVRYSDTVRKDVEDQVSEWLSTAWQLSEGTEKPELTILSNHASSASSA